MSDLYVGIDGGQTRTACVVLSRQGDLLGQGFAGSVIDLMHPADGERHMRQAISLALDGALGQAGAGRSDVAGIHLSLTGGLDWAEAAVEDLLPGVPSVVEADIINSLFCGQLGRPGIGLISGTGAVAYLRDSEGHERVSGGWGYLFGDEGSGQWMALEVVRLCAKMVDGILPETLLLQRVSAHFPQLGLRALVGGIYSAQLPRTALAPLAPVVLQAAQDGDPVAQDIIQRAATALNDLVVSVARYHALDPVDRVVVASGGPLYPTSPLWRQLERLLSQSLPDFRLKRPYLPPVLSAGYRCLLNSGLADRRQVLDRLQQQIPSLVSKSSVEASHAC